MTVITASSDGLVKLWVVKRNELQHEEKTERAHVATVNGENGDDSNPGTSRARHVGRLLGQYDTNSRVTCLAAFVMSQTTQPAITVPSLENGHTAASDESE